MVITPKKKQFPINRRIPNQASLHNLAPNTSVKTAVEENMLTTLLAGKAEHAQCGTRITPVAHSFFGYKSISEYQP
jgi:hypothetical protein